MPGTLVRELHEETGADLATTTPVALVRAVVDDWRNTDHAWSPRRAALFELDETVPATAGDDAADARWWPLPDDVDELAAALESEGGLYEPHRPLLRQALEHLAPAERGRARLFGPDEQADVERLLDALEAIGDLDLGGQHAELQELLG